ncbi:hypothetical protein A374_05791 [Fictibacillus macauensis ZFHKF-1]|uniref:VOC domain-containing protein n=1 Tax=Fictibacillus macauensis ZFHKF-1 TaxID=1196324 RepID=I8UHV2_9BACL|nr:VOC family protein [Fictibacillus macauensis]EIT86450.1 hypothetical protein A374_05791 [Fictibacillus macauensis ZFHKF-1]
MLLNHLNLCVDNLEEAERFFIHYFKFKARNDCNDVIKVLQDESGFTLVLSSLGGEHPTYPFSFHLGFYVTTAQEVDEIHQRLVADGYSTGVPKIVRGQYSFYFQALDGLLFEVTATE